MAVNVIELILAFVGSVCPGILFNVKKSNLVWIGFSGTFGWLAYSAVSKATGEVILSTFVGGVVVGLYSEIAARLFKSPATVFSVTGLFPLVPGIAAYNTVQFLVENKLAEAAAKALETIACAGAIAFGILLMSAVFRSASKFNGKFPSESDSST